MRSRPPRCRRGARSRSRPCPRERRKGETIVAYDLRPFVDAIEVAEVHRRGRRLADPLRMTLRHDPEKGVGRPDELLAALRRSGSAFHARSLARERLVLATPPAPVEPAARARGPRPRPGREGSALPGPRPATGEARRTTAPHRG